MAHRLPAVVMGAGARCSYSGGKSCDARTVTRRLRLSCRLKADYGKQQKRRSEDAFSIFSWRPSLWFKVHRSVRY
ncbi:hypothetical protein ACP70R_027977 [Stipagrostis hirtigluma subsp. patula]